MRFQCGKCGMGVETDAAPGDQLTCPYCQTANVMPEPPLIRAVQADARQEVRRQKVRNRWWSTKRGVGVMLLGIFLGVVILFFAYILDQGNRAERVRWCDQGDAIMKLQRVQMELDVWCHETADWKGDDREIADAQIARDIRSVARLGGMEKDNTGKIGLKYPAPEDRIAPQEALAWLDRLIKDQQKAKEIQFAVMNASDARCEQLIWPIMIGILVAGVTVLVGLVGLIVALLRND